ncbi:ATP-binding cassette domain-containing protein [Roseospirillum parvum]|nr:ATP-binding cassette domain-containing protein [Roseospirillum parvum]
MLSARDIRKRFGEVEVLKGVSVDAHPGDVITILGASGSGKSTFLRCLNFLETPTGGSVMLHGEPIVTRPDGEGNHQPRDRRQLRRLRARVGFVFQQFNLWPHMTVLGNVAEGPRQVLKTSRAEAEARALALLEKVGLAERANFYPAHLSGGQQQRAAIARTLAMDPELILFDEPTSALDPELVGEVLEVIRGLAREGRTMLIVTHEMGFAREVATRTMFLHEGLVEEDGDPEALFTQPESERLRQFLRRHLS